GHGIKRNREERVVIEKAIAGADDGLAIARGVPRQTEARGNILVLTRYAFHNAQSFLRSSVDGRSCRKKRSQIGVVTQAVIDRQILGDAPGILGKEPNRDIVKGLIGNANALNIFGGNTGPIRLQASES